MFSAAQLGLLCGSAGGPRAPHRRPRHHPPQVPAQALQPNATNPLGIDPMFLAAAYYGAMAMDSDDAGAAGTDPASELNGR